MFRRQEVVEGDLAPTELLRLEVRTKGARHSDDVWEAPLKDGPKVGD